MTTEEEVMRLLRQADPDRRRAHAPSIDVTDYLAALRTRSATATLIDTDPTPTQRESRHRWPIIAVATAAAIVAAIVVVISRDDTTAPADTPIPTPIANGWIAFAAEDADRDGDIYVVREGSNPRRIAGSATDLNDEICPAFSPDGNRLAFGQATGNSSDGYSGDGALVITDLSADGVPTATTTIALDGMPNPPCATWSADGRWVAFGVGPRGNVDEVWLVDTQSDDIRRLTGLSATDLDWAPDDAELAIASDGIALYSVTADELHPLGDAEDVGSTAWSPDGRTIAVDRRPPGLGGGGNDSGDLRLMDADGTNERILIPNISAVHGVGPVWSPDGDRIAYQRRTTFCPAFDGSCSEETEVVLVTVNPDDPLDPAGSQVVIPPPQTTGPDGQPLWWYPWGVTWSPDGSALLYYAWAESEDLEIWPTLPAGIVAVPLDGETPPVVLSGDLGADVYSAFPWLPFQSWGRQQDG